ELALPRILVIKDENTAHPFRRRHLPRRHPLIHELLEPLRVPTVKRGYPYPHGATSLDRMCPSTNLNQLSPAAPSQAPGQEAHSCRGLNQPRGGARRSTHSPTRPRLLGPVVRNLPLNRFLPG